MTLWLVVVINKAGHTVPLEWFASRAAARRYAKLMPRREPLAYRVWKMVRA